MEALERTIVDTIVSDIKNRIGLSAEWDAIDPDLREEILESWRFKVKRLLNGKKPLKRYRDQSTADFSQALREFVHK